MRWVSYDDVLILHDKQIQRYGGSPGLRDEGALRAALARPQNLKAYGQPDLADLAAAYAHGIAKGHAFIDGNKRTSLQATNLFLFKNGVILTTPPVEVASMWLSLADSSLSQDGLADYIRENVGVLAQN